MRKFLALMCVVSAWLASSAFAEPKLDQAFKAIVRIRATIPEGAFTARTLGTEREGNGVLIDDQGLIITTGYLIVESEKIEVIGPEGKTVEAFFVGYDHETGFGLLRAGKPVQAPPMELGDSAAVKEGDAVLVAAYGGEDAVKGARVISRQEFAGYWEYVLEKPIITAPAHPGFAGAALIDRQGHLLGIGSLFTQMTAKGLGAIPSNVFIPIDLLKPIREDLLAAGRPRESSRPWLGLNVQDLLGRVAVVRTTPDGPAEKAGLQSGDLILKVKGKAVKGLADFYHQVWKLGKAGVEVPLTILHGTEIKEITVRSAERYQFLNLKPKKLI